MNQFQSIKLDLAPQHVDILLKSAAKQPFEVVSETIQLVVQQANNESLQNSVPPPESFVENEIRTAFNSIATMGPMDFNELMAALRAARVPTTVAPATHHPV